MQYASHIAATIAAYLVLTGCTAAPVRVPPIEQLLPRETTGPDLALSDQNVTFHLDGTLSMRGFSHPKDGRFAQFLQDLDLALSSNWARDRIRYYRFGSVIEEVRARPFYVSASQDSFFQSTKAYANTRIDNVFRKSDPRNLTIVMTDLFENDLDIGSIQESLRAASFPARSSLAIWQWEMPFSGAIYDFDFRSAQGREYAGSRPLYLLALGPEKSLDTLRHAIDGAVTTGKAQFLMLSSHLAANGQHWLNVTQTQHAGLVRSSPGDGQSAAYAVYRPSNGCSSAGLSFTSQLSPVTDGVISKFVPHSGSYQADLLSVDDANDKWSTKTAGSPQVQVAKGSALNVQVDCATLTASPMHLLRIRRIGTPEDIVLPEWVQSSNANSMEFNAALQRREPAWGDKTLNLAPLVRGLANTAVDGTPMASAYFYFMKN
ncbi:MAG: hypothetical protein M3Y72_01050 [Acidobacteriota bacterium]|nr:hypothetical protein [Acidobacteriota bacterium]